MELDGADRLDLDAGEFAGLAVLDVPHDVRTESRAAIGYDRHRVSQLQRGSQIVALPDADRDGVAGKPLLLEASLLPFLRREQATGFAVEVEDLKKSTAEILAYGCEIISDPGVIPVKFRAPGGTVAELVPIGRYVKPDPPAGR